MKSFFSKSNRRNFFLRSTVVGELAAIPGAQRLAAMVASSATDPAEVYTRLGLHPIINASGTYTHLGGSLSIGQSVRLPGRQSRTVE